YLEYHRLEYDRAHDAISRAWWPRISASESAEKSLGSRLDRARIRLPICHDNALKGTVTRTSVTRRLSSDCRHAVAVTSGLPINRTELRVNAKAAGVPLVFWPTLTD